jgi:cytochrome c biogenesis protein CcmG, thiol:disulfide interchange protein DsbE
VSDADVELPTPPGDMGSGDGGAPAKGRRRVAPFIVLAVAVLIAGLFWILVSADKPDSETAYSPLVDRAAPPVTAKTLDGKPFDLQRRKGSWVVLNFFNSTCVPCKTEHPELVDFAEQQRALGDQGVELYTVVWGNDSDNAVRQFFADNGGDWPVLTDPEGSIAVAFAVPKVPETWIIDPDGVVRERIISNTTAQFLTEQISALANA